MIEILNILTCLFGITGSIFVGEKKKIGFLLFIVSSISMFILGYMRDDVGIMILQGFFVGIDIYYYYKWTKEETMK